MRISANGLDLIKQFESFSGTVYRCPAGVSTIGYGHTGKHVNDGIVTEKLACEILAEDCFDAEQAIEKYVKVDLNQNQFDALVSFVFNVGTGAFKRSTLLQCLNDGYPYAAAEQFKRWTKAGGKEA